MNKILKDKNGSILVIFSLVIMTAIIFSKAFISVGHGIYERIKLQNAADAAACSAAIMQARAMNYAAYTNRAMISHLVLISHLTSLYSFTLFVNDIMNKAGFILKMIPIGNIIAVILESGSQAAVNIARINCSILIPYANALNSIISRSQDLYFKNTLISINNVAKEIAKDNDSRAEIDASIPLSIINSRLFTGSIGSGSWEGVRKVTLETIDRFFRERKGPFGYRGGTEIYKKDIKGFDRIKIPLIKKKKIISKEVYASEFGYSGIHNYLTLKNNEGDKIEFLLILKKNIKDSSLFNKNILEETDGRLTSISRAIVYYKRPDRNEEPNLFNPYWHVRLARIKETYLRRYIPKYLIDFILH